MADFLVSHCNFDESDIRLVTDARATTSAILDRLNWLISGAKAGDRIAFHYSGHETRVDECICPADFDWTEAHAIRDKQFNELFKQVPKGVDFTWVSDSCFSGDLAREMLLANRRFKVFPMPADIAWRMRTAETQSVKVSGFAHVIKDMTVVLVSGCSQRQTSADSEIDGRFNGALTYYFLQTLSAPNGLTQTLEQAVARTRAALHQNSYTQHPQLEGSRELIGEAFLRTPQQRRAAAVADKKIA